MSVGLVALGLEVLVQSSSTHGDYGKNSPENESCFSLLKPFHHAVQFVR